MEKKIMLFISIMLLLVPVTARAARYSVNGDGTVTDNVTGLMWQQEDDDTTRTWEQAITYCENLDIPPTSYMDWRLPNIKELRSIVDISRTGPAIDTSVFPNTSSSYWSSTAFDYNPDAAWMWASGYGWVSGNYKENTSYVRCVRGGQ